MSEIQVRVRARYLPEQSGPGRQVFAYGVVISNGSSRPAQLLRRYWRILDGHDQLREVHGDGVVGEQPRLLPGDEFSYSSGAVLETRTGTMEGHYIFCDDEGEEFQVPIPLFLLSAPGALH